MRNVLILVDVQNVFFGSRSYTKNKGRVDYVKLKSRLIEAASAYLGDSVHPTILGYVVSTPRQDGTAFFDFLRKVGYALRVIPYPEELKEDDKRWNGTVASMMQMDYLEHVSEYDMAIIVSGSGVFEKVFKASDKNWPELVRGIAAFENTQHSAYGESGNLVDLIISLDKSVLR